MSWIEIKKLREQHAEVTNSMKTILETANTEKRSITTEEDAKFNELSGKSDTIAADILRREKLYAAQDAVKPAETRTMPGKEDLHIPEQDSDTKAKEKRAAFQHFLRAGKEHLSENEVRSITIGNAGGVVGDRPFFSQIIQSMKSYTGVRDAGATVLTTGNGDPMTIQMSDDTNNIGRLVGEGASNTNQTDPTMASIQLGGWKFDSDWITASYEYLQDSTTDAEAYISGIASERLGRAFNLYTTTGTGSNQPKGLIPCGSAGKTTASKDAVAWEDFLDLFSSLDAAYRQTGRCVVMLHDTTLTNLRKIKAGTQGPYIFGAGEAAQPNTIGGFKFIINNNFGQLGTANATLAAIMEPSKYFIRDIGAPLVLRADEKFSDNGLVGFKIFMRMDGNNTDSNSIKLLKAAAS